ncbi:putative methyltransferase C9orf114 homolog [Centruroides sculpturatus]|uniref:putative methyltransferase C9orf114 homolog n=1 Tax=Centruroides sculpturatus TaxID=218467 RepID=UPI000C6DA369|nr:putative methyltransferase C9orf114 homolog [Centruroides sculpturatus]XP_023231342.1 putative methyltransferase C9orf114 homolog [Centruroides sculpturatus]
MSDENSEQQNHADKDISWKEWRHEKKQLHKKWKEQRLLKKLEKKRKREEAEKSKEIELKAESNNGRDYTLSIALPGSILDNAQTAELQTLLAGQIARAATIFNVDEIVVFDETGSLHKSEKNAETLIYGDKGYSNIQLSRILQYLECPQYLRKELIPLHPDLKYSGLLNPLDASHHLRATDECRYREGVVANLPIKEGKGSYVRVGLKKEARIDKALEIGTRVTVRLEPDRESKKHLKGVAVSPSAPRVEAGIYWGYNVRLASSLSAAIAECSFKDGYDIIVGTSDKGDNVDKVKLSPFKHMLVVFGGLGGIEASIESDEMLKVEDPRFLFHYYLNTCPDQGSRTIRTEEAILVSLAALRPKILKCQKKR